MVRYHLNHKMVDWEDQGSYIFTNPKLGKADQQLIKVNKIPPERSIVWVGSSGTTAHHSYKLIGLKKSAFLASAVSVCKHLQVTESDVWLNVLPRFHVGGLSIEVRSHVSGCLVVQHEQPHFQLNSFMQAIENYKVTITSLVPTQVYEITKHNLKAPKTLRVVLVGGGNLNERLYQKAVQLGWPLVLTYGMTELCSQIATSRLEDIHAPKKPKAYILKHIEAKTDSLNQLYIKSKSLFFAQLIFTKEQVQVFKPSADWFKTNDLVNINPDRSLDFIGRKSSQVKVSGELVNLNQLNQHLESLLLETSPSFSGHLIASKNLKYDHQIDFVVEGIQNLKVAVGIKEKFNQKVAKFESIKNVYFLKEIPKNSMGKFMAPVFFNS